MAGRPTRAAAAGLSRACSPRAPDRLDQVPLAHLRAARDVLALRNLVQLLAIAVLERVAGLAAAPAAARRLLPELAARALRQVSDGALTGRGAASLLDVALGGLSLLGGGHERYPLGVAVLMSRIPVPAARNRA